MIQNPEPVTQLLSQIAPCTSPTIHEIMNSMANFSPSSLRDLQALVVTWLEGVYPNRTYQDVLIKFLEEVAELFKNPNAGELADLMILILDLAHLLKIDLANATVNKMIINGERKWEIDPETGIMHHVRP